MVATADASAAATQCILHASTLNDIFNDAQWKTLQLKIQVSWWQKSKQITVIHLQPSIIILRCIRRSFLKTSIVKLVSMLLNFLIARLSKIKWRDKENHSNLMTRLSPLSFRWRSFDLVLEHHHCWMHLFYPTRLHWAKMCVQHKFIYFFATFLLLLLSVAKESQCMCCS